MMITTRGRDLTKKTKQRFRGRSTTAVVGPNSDRGNSSVARNNHNNGVGGSKKMTKKKEAVAPNNNNNNNPEGSKWRIAFLERIEL
jgi:hypothetical protein